MLGLMAGLQGMPAMGVVRKVMQLLTLFAHDIPTFARKTDGLGKLLWWFY